MAITEGEGFEERFTFERQHAVLEFARELEAQATEPPDGDPYLKAFSQAALTAYREAGNPFRQFVKDLIDHSPDMLPSHAVNKIQREIQIRLLSEFPKYPDGTDSVEFWPAILRRFTDPASPDFEDFARDVKENETISNVDDRYAGPALALSHLGHRLPPEPDIADIGTSQLHGPKRLALQNPKHTQNTDSRIFADMAFDGIEYVADELVEDDSRLETTEGFKNITVPRVPVGKILGIDKNDAFDPEIRKRAFGYSFYPQEYKDLRRTSRYVILDVATPKGVSFFQADASDPSFSPQQLPVDVPHEYDVVTILTTLYQCSESERRQILDNALQLVKFGGIIIVQDFATPEPDNPGKLHFYEHWFKGKGFRYKTLIYDTANPDRGFQEMFVWRNGRCKKFMLGKDFYRLIGREL